MIAPKLALPALAALTLGPLAALTGGGWAPATDARAAERDAIGRAYDAALLRARRSATSGEMRMPPATWDQPRIGRSEHYEIRTTQGRGYATARAKDLEDMLAIFQDALGTDFVPRTRFIALIHPTIELYGGFGDAHSDERSSIFGGFFDPNNPEQAVATVYDSNLALERMYLTHAATQQFLARAFPGAEPTAAVTQGLAAYFQSFWAYDYFVDRFEALRDETEGRALIPLPDLLDASRADYTDRTQDRFFQLAMLFTYLRVMKPETRTEFEGGKVKSIGPFDDYIRRAVRGESLVDHPLRPFLTEVTQIRHQFNLQRHVQRSALSCPHF